MKPTSLGVRVNAVLTQLLLLPQAGAIDYGKDSISQGKGGHGTHKERGKAPMDTGSLAVEWADHFRRLVELAELDLAMERGEVPRPRMVQSNGGNRSATQSQERARRITRAAVYQGRRPEFVAYAEGCSVATVERVRRASRQDPTTGLPTGAKPLTATPRNQLRAHLDAPTPENTTTTTEDR